MGIEQGWSRGVRRLLARVLAAVGVSFGGPAVVVGQAVQVVDPDSIPRPEGQATRIDTPVTLDGVLDEEAWSRATILTDFIQSQPNPGAAATERTEVRLVYDDEYLYVGGMLYDSDPDGFVVQSLERDFPGGSTRNADVFGITLDTFLDRRNSFIFLINPLGAYRDGQTFDDSRNLDFGWDGVIYIETRTTDDGWIAEVAIPWTSLRFPAAPGEHAWGANFLRRVRRINEDSYWSPVHRRDPLHRMSRAGTLRGFEGLTPGRNLSIKPHLVADSRSGTLVASSQRGESADAGLDLKWGITPQLTLDGTFRTDFAQVEVDQEQVNLTRFPLFFPEQRDFFVENSGAFRFGDQSERNYRQGARPSDFTLFHSRRIGLVSGLPVPILGGARLSGKAGPFEVGLLNMQTRTTDGLAPAENFSVMRLRRRIFSGSDIGVMVLNREVTADDFVLGDSPAPTDNQSYGVDANLRFGGLIVNSYLVGSRTPDVDGSSEAAGRVSVHYRDQRWNAGAMFRAIDDGFDPGMGFIRRAGIRQSYATLGIQRQPSAGSLQEIAPYAEVDYVTDLGSRLLTRTGTVGLDIDFRDGSQVRSSIARRFERLDETFEIGGFDIPVDDYDFTEGSVSYQSNAGRAFSFTARATGGGFFNGDRVSTTLSGRWIANHQLAINASAGYNRIALPDGSFDSNVFRIQVKYGFSTTRFASANVQFNDATQQLVTQFRFNLIHSPLSDLFFVYTERRDTDSRQSLERLFTVKATKFFAF